MAQKGHETENTHSEKGAPEKGAHDAGEQKVEGTKGPGQNIEGHEQTEEGRQIAELKALAAEYKDMLQRLQAEFENAAKRAEREREDFMKFAGARTVQGFLPVIDSVEEALKQAEKTGNTEMKKGLEMIRAQLVKALESNGVKRIETAGKKFDHALHEVLMTGNEAAKEDDAVLEEFGKGYTLGGKVLRPAKVKVNKKS